MGMKTCYELFAGAGGAGCGMRAAGYAPIGGIEYHAPAANIYDLNHEIPVTRANILYIDSIPTVDLLWASPPCPAFSQANPNKGETERDINLAKHIAKLIVESRPRHIAIENVRGYATSQSLNIIWAALEGVGYKVDDWIYNAANYGAPTTRERLIVRASLERMGEVVQTHRSPRQARFDNGQLSLFGLEPLPVWVTWWDAIEDRIDELPRSTLTKNQKAAIGNRLKNLPLLVDGAGNNYGTTFTTRSSEMPAHTITATVAKHPIRLLIDTTRSCPPQGCTVLGQNSSAHTITAAHGKRLGTRSRILIERVGYYSGQPKIYSDTTPAPTIRAHQHIDDRTSYRVAYNVVDAYDCYAADIRCLAAWCGFPADYRWGDNKGEAGRAIGNAVPPKLAEAIALSFNAKK